MRHEAMSFVWADDCMYDMKITHWMKSGGDNNGMKTVVIIFMDFSMVDSYSLGPVTIQKFPLCAYAYDKLTIITKHRN